MSDFFSKKKPFSQNVKNNLCYLFTYFSENKAFHFKFSNFIIFKLLKKTTHLQIHKNM